MTKNQIESEGIGEKDSSPATARQKKLAVCNNVVAAYKSVIVSDEPEFNKLARDLTKAFVTASAIITRLNRAQK